MLTVTARTRRPGTHHWPAAPEHRAYLRTPHRHLFHIEAEVIVRHGERDVEFHDLVDALERLWPQMAADQETPGNPPDVGAQSCESMAERIGQGLQTQGYDLVRVRVSEDGEADGTWWA